MLPLGISLGIPPVNRVSQSETGNATGPFEIMCRVFGSSALRLRLCNVSLDSMPCVDGNMPHHMRNSGRGISDRASRSNEMVIDMIG